VKKLISVAVLSALMAGCNQDGANKAAEKAAEPKTDLEKQSYSMGALYSSRITQDLSKNNIELDKDMLRQGFLDGLEGKAVMDDEQMNQQMMAFQQNVQQAMQEKQNQDVEKNKADGEAYIAKMVKEDDSVKAAESGSGLHFKVLEEGDKENYPAATDEVRVHYTGTLIDGTKFDSSVDRGEPINFPLNRVIPGWTEGVQLMSKGAKYRFYIPSDLAYRDQGRPGTIPGGATLVFDVELLEINPETEQQAQKQPEEAQQ
jgi:FKBP-type peptidyl-prolyl cis-trans isomerase FkpA